MKFIKMCDEELTRELVESINVLLTQLESCEQKGYKEEGMPSYTHWSRSYSGNDVFLAIEEDEVKGVLDFDVKDNVCRINEIVVDDSMRGNGIGKLLYEELVNYLKTETWANEIKLSVRSNNVAVGFYKQLGFNPFQIEMNAKI